MKKRILIISFIGILISIIGLKYKILPALSSLLFIYTCWKFLITLGDTKFKKDDNS